MAGISLSAYQSKKRSKSKFEHVTLTTNLKIKLRISEQAEGGFVRQSIHEIKTGN